MKIQSSLLWKSLENSRSLLIQLTIIARIYLDLTNFYIQGLFWEIRCLIWVRVKTFDTRDRSFNYSLATAISRHPAIESEKVSISRGV